ncbi:hypothetical protein Pelo_12481 [Pelomyxa schiedti]|nr:hypothetical protein Pelo_12481 [Pelomyxa schiedti]
MDPAAFITTMLPSPPLQQQQPEEPTAPPQQPPPPPPPALLQGGGYGAQQVGSMDDIPPHLRVAVVAPPYPSAPPPSPTQQYPYHPMSGSPATLGPQQQPPQPPPQQLLFYPAAPPSQYQPQQMYSPATGAVPLPFQSQPPPPPPPPPPDFPVVDGAWVVQPTAPPLPLPPANSGPYPGMSSSAFDASSSMMAQSIGGGMIPPDASTCSASSSSSSLCDMDPEANCGGGVEPSELVGDMPQPWLLGSVAARVLLCSDCTVCCGGDMLRGVLGVNTKVPLAVTRMGNGTDVVGSHVLLDVVGRWQVHFSTHHTRRDSKGRTHTSTHHHYPSGEFFKAQFSYYDETCDVPSSAIVEYPPGKHFFPFCYKLPDNLPPSLGTKGSAEYCLYSITGVIKANNKRYTSSPTYFYVVNTKYAPVVPISKAVLQISGLEATIETSKPCYEPGESIEATVTITNVERKIEKVVVSHVGLHKYRNGVLHKIFSQEPLEGVNKGTSTTWTIQPLPIPIFTTPSVSVGLLKWQHFIDVELFTGLFRFNLHMHCPIVILSPTSPRALSLHALSLFKVHRDFGKASLFMGPHSRYPPPYPQSDLPPGQEQVLTRAGDESYIVDRMSRSVNSKARPYPFWRDFVLPSQYHLAMDQSDIYFIDDLNQLTTWVDPRPSGTRIPQHLGIEDPLMDIIILRGKSSNKCDPLCGINYFLFRSSDPQMIRTQYKKNTDTPVWGEEDNNAFRIGKLQDRLNVVIFVYDHIRLLPNKFIGSVNIDLNYVPVHVSIVDWFPVIQPDGNIWGELQLNITIHNNKLRPLRYHSDATHIDCVSRTLALKPSNNLDEDWVLVSTAQSSASTTTTAATTTKSPPDSSYVPIGQPPVAFPEPPPPPPPSSLPEQPPPSYEEVQRQNQRYAAAFMYQPPPLVALPSAPVEESTFEPQTCPKCGKQYTSYFCGSCGYWGL